MIQQYNFWHTIYGLAQLYVEQFALHRNNFHAAHRQLSRDLNQRIEWILLPVEQKSLANLWNFSPFSGESWFGLIFSSHLRSRKSRSHRYPLSKIIITHQAYFTRQQVKTPRLTVYSSICKVNSDILLCSSENRGLHGMQKL